MAIWDLSELNCAKCGTLLNGSREFCQSLGKMHELVYHGHLVEVRDAALRPAGD